MKNKHQSNLRNSAFTLIELLVVISIISLLSSIIFASLNGARLKTKDIKRISELGELGKALDFYFLDHDYYPRLTALSPTPGESCGSRAGTFQSVSGEENSWCALMNLLSPYIDPVQMEEQASMYRFLYDSNPGDGYQTYGMSTRIFSKSLAYLAEKDGGYNGEVTYYDPDTGDPTDAWIYETGQQPSYCYNKYTGAGRMWDLLIQSTVCNGGN